MKVNPLGYFLWLLFDLPDGSIWSNLVASLICLIVGGITALVVHTKWVKAQEKRLDVRFEKQNQKLDEHHEKIKSMLDERKTTFEPGSIQIRDAVTSV